jgi:(R,R)-butanediol dehydrogenase / meso-butanediol dehydrogenase / diacetyl reductase
MRAVVIADDRSLEVRQVEERPLEAGEARVEVAACGIGGSDLHLRPSAAVPAGAIMGHEFSGRVTELGGSVSGWSEGDRVAVFPFAPCGACPMCVRGDVHVCIHAAKTGLGLGANPGAYAERVVVRADTMHRLPEELSDEHGALVEPLAVGVHGVGVAEVDPSEPVAVIGAGPIGVMTALAARAAGHERIVVVERNGRRRARMEALGFTAVGSEGVHMAVVEALGGTVPGAVFECAGHPSAPQLAIELVAPRGRIVLLGALEEASSITTLVLLVKEAEMRSSFAYKPDEFQHALELLRNGHVPADDLLTGSFPLEEADALFAELLRPETEHLKVLLRP